MIYWSNYEMCFTWQASCLGTLLLLPPCRVSHTSSKIKLKLKKIKDTNNFTNTILKSKGTFQKVTRKSCVRGVIEQRFSFEVWEGQS